MLMQLRRERGAAIAAIVPIAAGLVDLRAERAVVTLREGIDDVGLTSSGSAIGAPSVGGRMSVPRRARRSDRCHGEAVLRSNSPM
ncbi:hypothetical protein [Cupriavidus plantarum]|uniref:hypothetical protein n=1 Tax=Cupriavidus plantarum TaxID=942865 RepID=UPI0011C3C427|nr:hypothetical protein [Cupriavidus plantarum]